MIPAFVVAVVVTAAILAVETFVYFSLRALRRRSLETRQLLAAGIGLLGVAAMVAMVVLLGLDRADTILSVIGATVPIYVFLSAALLKRSANDAGPPAPAPRKRPPPQ